MTEEEARRIVVALQQGRRFVARFQQQEWTLHVSDDGRFRKWTCEHTREGRREDVQMMTEREVIDMLVRWYRYEALLERLQ